MPRSSKRLRVFELRPMSWSCSAVERGVTAAGSIISACIRALSTPCMASTDWGGTLGIVGEGNGCMVPVGSTRDLWILGYFLLSELRISPVLQSSISGPSFTLLFFLGGGTGCSIVVTFALLLLPPTSITPSSSFSDAELASGASSGLRGAEDFRAFRLSFLRFRYLAFALVLIFGG